MIEFMESLLRRLKSLPKPAVGEYARPAFLPDDESDVEFFTYSSSHRAGQGAVYVRDGRLLYFRVGYHDEGEHRFTFTRVSDALKDEFVNCIEGVRTMPVSLSERLGMMGALWLLAIRKLPHDDAAEFITLMRTQFGFPAMWFKSMMEKFPIVAEADNLRVVDMNGFRVLVSHYAAEMKEVDQMRLMVLAWLEDSIFLTEGSYPQNWKMLEWDEENAMVFLSQQARKTTAEFLLPFLKVAEQMWGPEFSDRFFFEERISV